MRLAELTIVAVVGILGAVVSADLRAASIATAEGLPGSPYYRIAQYADVAATSGMVVIAGGSADGVVSGAVFEAYRAASPTTRMAANTKPIWVKTGELKAVQLSDRHSIAMVTESGTPLSKGFFPKYPGVMAGDLVIEKQVDIAQGLALTPAVALTYQQLFQDPNAGVINLELSEAGKEMLRKASAGFADKHVGMLMVEGHTDQVGSSERNQIESYQRAFAVRQFLIGELGFDESRLTAIGIGETEPLEDSFVPGFRDTNRRIVIKVVE